ncbi:MAG: YtxH domain-containing protein [Chloroflexi bacterium]|nr:YtxH domain-containing protein [Chloroflexota bacterium]MBI2976858.1 YtxH domain-containing protein [Chloroflexota bacterium]MBI4315878.1 YtxH domain-containing protein [Chloroflexota bacterium]MBI5293328.1 YtxH domain-containing protein [Chloroflexota bacterium]
MQRFFSFVSGAFCGAVVGSVAALLLAPLSGRELQRLSRARAEAMVDDVRKAYEERQAELKAQLEALKAPRLVS